MYFASRARARDRSMPYARMYVQSTPARAAADLHEEPILFRALGLNKS